MASLNLAIYLQHYRRLLVKKQLCFTQAERTFIDCTTGDCTQDTGWSFSIRISSILVTPPEAITGNPEYWAKATVCSIFTPCIIPSRAISVYTILDTPASANRLASSVALTSVTLAQPSVATIPSLASIPTIMRPANFYRLLQQIQDFELL